MRKYIQNILQTIFLVLFIVLVIKGKAQIWMGLLLLGIVASFIFGRFYCGWICSINTILGWVSSFKKKFHIKSIRVPGVLMKPWLRYTIFGLFIAVFLFVMITGKQLPVLPVLFGLGVLSTLFFPEDFWHRHLCPYGTLLHVPAYASRMGMEIEENKCNNCSLCSRVCPAKAIVIKDSQHVIQKQDCLVCMKCETVCKQQAIQYR